MIIPGLMRRVALCILVLCWASTAAADEGRPDEDALFGGDDESAELVEAPTEKDADRAEAELDRPFMMGGSLYLRLQSYVGWEGAFLEQPLSMPSLLDLYVDARPDPRVRAFASGRLTIDPTVEEGDTTLFGTPAERTNVVLDQLWIKTDIARTLYLTAGVQRVKWGASRLWNPTDFLNSRRRDPLDFFDDRTGLTLLKLHVPIESLGWNAYAIAFFDGANTLEDIGGAVRLEMVAGTAEFSLSALAGADRKTSFGLDVSVGLWDIDFHAELSLTDERGTSSYGGEFDISDLANPVLPTETTRDNYYGRVSAGLTYTFKSSDTDLMILGAEYFYNPLGVSDKRLYPWLIAEGQFESFYLAEHYAALVWAVPAPGDWDDVTFTTSTLANLSDMSFVSRLDVSLRLHRMLRLEAFVMFHYGEPGGEFRFEAEVPEGTSELVGVPVPEGKIVAPMLDFGLNLRVSL
jgi:hypothetical protein